MLYSVEVCFIFGNGDEFTEIFDVTDKNDLDVFIKDFQYNYFSEKYDYISPDLYLDVIVEFNSPFESED